MLWHISGNEFIRRSLALLEKGTLSIHVEPTGCKARGRAFTHPAPMKPNPPEPSLVQANPQSIQPAWTPYPAEPIPTRSSQTQPKAAQPNSMKFNPKPSSRDYRPNQPNTKQRNPVHSNQPTHTHIHPITQTQRNPTQSNPAQPNSEKQKLKTDENGTFFSARLKSFPFQWTARLLYYFPLPPISLSPSLPSHSWIQIPLSVTTLKVYIWRAGGRFSVS